MQDDNEDLRRFWLLMSFSLLLRVGLAAYAPLGVDESYAIAVAREFSWSFFDHPPLSFWLPVAAAKLTGWDVPLIYRLPPLVFGTLTLALVWASGREMAGPRAGFWAAALFAVAPAFALAGVFVVPDGALFLGSSFAGLWLVRAAQRPDGGAPWQWGLIGVGLAFALASKYQAALIPVATLFFMLFSRRGRRWLARPGPWIGAAVGMIGLAPVVYWNMSHGWASFGFHAGRTGDGMQIGNLALMLAGQALYLLPPVMLAAIAGIGAALGSGKPERMLLAFLALFPIVLFNAIYLFSTHSFPHWAVPGWFFGLPLAGVWAADLPPRRQRRIRRWLVLFAALAWLLISVVFVHMRTGLLTRFLPGPVPTWDRTETVFDYSALPGLLDKEGALDGVQLLLVRNWIEGGAISTALHGQYPVRVLQPPRHHFAYMSGAKAGGKALLLVPGVLSQEESARSEGLKLARQLDENARELSPVVLKRGGVPYVVVVVFLLHVPPT